MRWELWTVGATLVVASYGCPRTIMCAPGEVLVEGRCAFDCPPGSTSGCRDTGVNVDATADGGDAMPCPMGQTRCGAVCVDLQSSVDHCGRCDMRCRAPEAGTAMCSMGSCTLACPSQTHECGGACVSNDAVESCGTRCEPCPASAGSRALCTAQMCAFECLPGFERVGDACEARVPRPVFPPGTSTVSSHQPTLRWELGAGTDGAVVEVCRDRACTMRVAMFDATGTSARPSMALPASTVLFWRLRGRVGTIAGTRFSPTWQFRTRATSAASVDTAYGTELDINGDGFTDVAMGAPNVAPARGGVQFRLGSSRELGAPQQVTSPYNGGGFGRFVTSIGDVNGDGFGDFAIGSHLATVGTFSNAGCVFVHSGAADGMVGAETSRICGTAAAQRFGVTISGGDVNRDGYSDVVVGAPGASANGRVLVFQGSARGVSPTPAFELEGTASDPSVGGSCSTGDVNGDGYADIVVGAFGRGGPGSVLLFRGSPSAPSAALVIATGGGSTSEMGFSVHASGDANGDGCCDILAADPSGSVVGRGNPGSVLLLLGEVMAAPRRVLAFDGALSGDRFGSSVSFVNDGNSDGYDEVLIGAPAANVGTQDDAGAVYLFRGNSSGASTVTSTTIQGVATLDELGSKVASCADINGDGRGDFAVGVPGADPLGRSNAGTAHVYFGGSSPTLHRTVEGSAAFDSLGTALASRSPGHSFGSPRSTLWCARR